MTRTSGVPGRQFFRRVLRRAIVACVVAHMLAASGVAGAKEEELEPESGVQPSTDEAVAVEQPGDWLPGKFSAGVALTSNYVYRGITLTDNDPAIQGTLEYELQTGLLGTSVYIGTFGSNTKLAGDTDTAHVEIDALFGIRGDIGDTGLSWDLGGAFYSYPGTPRRDNFDYWEIPLRLKYKPVEVVELQLFNAYSPEYQFNTGTANYTSGLVTVDVPNGYVGWQLFGGVGYQYVDKSASGTDWTFGTTVTIKGVYLTVAYTDTNYHARECGGNNQCDAKAVFTVGAAF